MFPQTFNFLQTNPQSTHDWRVESKQMLFFDQFLLLEKWKRGQKLAKKWEPVSNEDWQNKRKQPRVRREKPVSKTEGHCIDWLCLLRSSLLAISSSSLPLLRCHRWGTWNGPQYSSSGSYSLSLPDALQNYSLIKSPVVGKFFQRLKISTMVILTHPDGSASLRG